MIKNLKSQTEKDVYYWLLELKERDYIRKFEYETKTFNLFNGAYYDIEKQLKTKTKIITKTLLQKCSYTPDFIVEWRDKALDKLVSCESLEHPIYCDKYNISYLEVKPSFDQNNKTQFARMNIKWVYQKYGEYVQIVKPYEPKNGKKSFLFKDTFTPEKFIYTDKTLVKKNLHYEVKTIDEYFK